MGSVFLAVSLAVLLQQDAGRASREFPVRMQVQADPAATDHTQRIRVTLTIADGYHIFAVPLGIEEVFNDTLLTLSVKSAKIAYPPGEPVKCEPLGTYYVYRKQVTLDAVIKRAAGDKTPVEVRMRVRPLESTGCRWLTRILKATVP